MAQQTEMEKARQVADTYGLDLNEISPFSLDSVTSSKGFPPQKIVMYGVPGIGKTTFAATFPKPILLRSEDGAAALDVPTFPGVLKNLGQFDEAIRALQGKHDYQTLVLDSLDWLEPLVWKSTCRENDINNIEDLGYGKGYVKADDTWRRVQGRLDRLRLEKGMNIITIAHAAAVQFDPPDSDPYTRYTLKLHKRAAPMWMEWADMILFLNYKANVVRDEKAGPSARAKAKGSGDRIIYTQERPAYQAKCRWPLDAEIFIGTDPSWSGFHQQLSEATQGAYTWQSI